MRTNDILLDGFNDIRTLQRYLYMSDEHYIEIENVIGVKLRIRMGENLHYYCKNMNFPDLPDACFSETSLDKGTQRKTTENELPSLTQCTA